MKRSIIIAGGIAAALAVGLAAALSAGRAAMVPADAPVTTGPLVRAGRPPIVQGPAPALWAHLTPGEYGVGYTVLHAVDSTRTARGTEAARPVQIVVWYPSRAPFVADGSRYRDYYLLTASQDGSTVPEGGEARRRIDRFVDFLGSNGVPEAAARAWLASPMAGVPGADPADGRHPLVLLAQGNFHSAYNQAVLAEYLASHGYVVATTPSPALIDGPMKEGESAYRQANVQALDLELAIATVRALPYVDADRIAVVGHSFGARAALLLGTRHRLTGLASLDGGIANRLGREWLDDFRFDRSGWTTPVLHLYQEGDPAVRPDFELIDGLVNAPRTVIRVDSLPHLGFSSLGFVADAIPGFDIGPPVGDLGLRASAVAEVTRRFLDRVSRGLDVELLDVPGSRYLTSRDR